MKRISARASARRQLPGRKREADLFVQHRLRQPVEGVCLLGGVADRHHAHTSVLGRFAIDFVVVRTAEGQWEAYAIEVNLRKGGTTHPFLTLQFLTDGVYDADKAVFITPGGREKHFVATDHLESPSYRALSPDDLFDIAIRRGLHFNQTRETGVVFHMLASLAENGRIGMVAVADSAAEADALYRLTQSVLDEEVRLALAPRELPAS